MEKHPLFSTLSREKRELSNGQELINFKESKLVSKEPRGCFTSGVSRFDRGLGIDLGTQFCRDREIIEESCIHQFIIENKKVQNLGYNWIDFHKTKF